MRNNLAYCGNFDHGLHRVTKINQRMVAHPNQIRLSAAYQETVPEPQAAMPSPAPRSADANVSAVETLVSYPPDLHQIVLAVRAMAARQKLGSERAMAEALQALRANGEIAAAEAKRKPLVGHNAENLVRDTNPMEVIEMRLAIEPFLARLAALRASPFEMAAIEEAATTAANVDTGTADLKFHKLIAASSGNKLAASLYSLLRRVASDARVRLNASRPACPKRTRQRDAEHRAIAQAILARDPDAAEQTMRLHLAAVQKLVIERLNPLAAAV
jgi:GntR family transcriptional regulator, transcriptional repressor for pyruvate dehydrogenase complex